MNVKDTERRLTDEQPELTEKIRRGERATAILGDELFKSAVRVARERAVSEFEGSDLGDDKTRLRARLRLEALTDIVSELHSVMTDGEVAEKKLGMLKSALAAAKQRLLRRVA